MAREPTGTSRRQPSRCRGVLPQSARRKRGHARCKGPQDGPRARKDPQLILVAPLRNESCLRERIRWSSATAQWALGDGGTRSRAACGSAEKKPLPDAKLATANPRPSEDPKVRECCARPSKSFS